MGSDLNPESPLNIQIMTGLPVCAPGYVALVIHNCPTIMTQDSEGNLIPVPGIRLCARQAMEVGMNLIHIAKLSEQYAAQASSAEQG